MRLLAVEYYRTYSGGYDCAKTGGIQGVVETTDGSDASFK